MQKIETPNPKSLRMCRCEVLRFTVRIGPRHRNMDQNSFLQVRIDLAEGRFALLDRDLATEYSESNRRPQFVPVKWSKRQRLSEALHQCQGLSRISMGRIDTRKKARIGVTDHEKLLVWPRIALFHDDISGEDFISINALQTRGEVGPLFRATLVRRRRRNGCYNFTPFGHIDPLTFFHPVQDGAEIVSNLPDRRCLHVTQTCDTSPQLSRRSSQVVAAAIKIGACANGSL
jgi:hypothetical protein